MKIIEALSSWEFLASSFIIYSLCQFLIGILFSADIWQVTSGFRFRIKKVIEMGLPVILGLIGGYLLNLPLPELMGPDAMARSVYYGFSGGLSAIVHGAVETVFPSIVAKVVNNIKTTISPSSGSPPAA